MEKKKQVSLFIITMLAFIMYKALPFANQPPSLVPETKELQQTDYSQVKSAIEANSGKREIPLNGSAIEPVTDTDGRSGNMLKLFKYIGRKFGKSLNEETHLGNVSAFFLSFMEKDEADKVMKLYMDFLKCEQNLAHEIKNWPVPDTPEEALAFLLKIKDFRRIHLGLEEADSLYGQEHRKKEYLLKKISIGRDDSLYGDEKTALIKDLEMEMWGNEWENLKPSPSPYDSYREKINLYKKDLDELPEGERQEMIDNFMKEVFTREVYDKLSSINRELDSDKEVELKYRNESAVINSDVSLTAQQKSSALNHLQQEMFGIDGASSFKRREAIRKGSERMIITRDNLFLKNQ